jgi:Raf kinase inhibitor-like YbhB/YbcL family protein
MKRTVRQKLVAFSVEAATCVAFLACPGCWRGESPPAEDATRLTIALGSPAFPEAALIPRANTCDGSDRSPPLEWSGVPTTAKTLALICEDPDAPLGTWSHWVMIDLPPNADRLPEGIPPQETVTIPGTEGAQSPSPGVATARQGRNDFGKIGYGGPCPPGGTHRYVFHLYALDVALQLGPRFTRGDVRSAIQGHVLAEGRLTGKYARER